MLYNSLHKHKTVVGHYLTFSNTFGVDLYKFQFYLTVFGPNGIAPVCEHVYILSFVNISEHDYRHSVYVGYNCDLA